MPEAPRTPPSGRVAALARRGLALAALAAIVLCAGCIAWHHESPRPGATRFGAATVTLPARLIGNTLVVAAKWDKFGPYHFLIDTGASVTLVSPELAQRYREDDEPEPAIPQVRVQSSAGATTLLPATVISHLELGKLAFERVPALIYDCSSLTSQLGIKIDGILAFPLFREARLTLDYPHSRVVLRPVDASGAPPGSTIAFNNTNKSPLIPVRLGDRTFIVLIDSGSDEAFSLNPVGLSPKFAFGPVEGPIVSSLTGDLAEPVGRLADTLYLGQYAVPRPVVDLTADLSALGGGILKYFTITFDQEHDEVTFFRDAPDAIAVPGRRSVGLSFNRTPAYWRVVGVLPGSPADLAKVEQGDLVTKIDGEPVARWDLRRYDQAVANREAIVVTFLNGTRETDKRLPVAELVP
jgi:hypothetical protein